MVEALLVLAGVFFGIGISVLIRHKNFVGTLRIDQSDWGDSPYMFLDLDRPVNQFRKKRFVFLWIENKNYISHK